MYLRSLLWPVIEVHVKQVSSNNCDDFCDYFLSAPAELQEQESPLDFSGFKRRGEFVSALLRGLHLISTLGPWDNKPNPSRHSSGARKRLGEDSLRFFYFCIFLFANTEGIWSRGEFACGFEWNSTTGWDSCLIWREGIGVTHGVRMRYLWAND